MSPITLAAGLALARSLATQLPREWVPLARLAGRTLAQDVVPRTDLPPGDVAAMDGWALRADGPSGPRRVVGESAAGSPWAGSLVPEQAVRISTGALLPSGADAVVRIEDGEEVDGRIALASARPGKDVRRRGEDLAAGRPVLLAGTRLTAPEVGVVAACGRTGAYCRMHPSVALLATGSELADPGDPPTTGRVYDSNRHGLGAQAEAAGARVARSERVPDDPERIERALSDALEGPRACDLVVVVGGVSVGCHDHVRRALERIGVELALESLAIRPGRPTLIGRRTARRVLGLPGNPAAAALAFHVLGRPLLGAEGHWTRLPLGRAWRSRRDVDELLRCTERGGVVEPLPVQGSSSVSSLVGADCVAWLPRGRTRFQPGDPVMVSRLD